ncbi:hypothetical protein CM240_2866 [Clostridium bornimense]|uniref:DUF116 domain-containing protein n=1 Tax=Clostridium bornimense TaxID=1216932 RepID=W6RZU8_9CLOT|nr:DUF116 domain-containing protein [Clostridium bornimense]CDM69983.1 hypothetical protein CM240_2866 [Clostridium bornimense]
MNGNTYEIYNCSEYYSTVEKLSDIVSKKIIDEAGRYINDFMKETREGRSKEEYSIEILFISVIINEYIGNGVEFKNIPKSIFNILIKLRNGKYKEKVDKLRGRLATKVLIRTTEFKGTMSLKELEYITRWMEATGDFKEEVERIKKWISFLKEKDDNYNSVFFAYCNKLNQWFISIGKEYLGKYTENVDSYLKQYKKDHNNKEDIIYCGRSEVQYHLNMVAAEIMNKVYREEFKKCKDRIVFLPDCMRGYERKCMREKAKQGYKCKGCTESCSIHRITKLGLEKNFDTIIIPHETALFSVSSKKAVGIIGIACPLNLLSGGWKALRMGFIPQCVPLNYCGCDKHWRKEAISTNISIERFYKIYNGI